MTLKSRNERNCVVKSVSKVMKIVAKALVGSACLVGAISILERIKARVNKIVIVACLFVDKMSCFCSFGSFILCYDWKQWCIQVIAPCYMQ